MDYIGGWWLSCWPSETIPLNIRITLTLEFPWREVGKLNSALFFGSPISHAFQSFPRSVFICKLCGPLRIIVVLSQSGNVNNWINITAVINCWTQNFVRQSDSQTLNIIYTFVIPPSFPGVTQLNANSSTPLVAIVLDTQTVSQSKLKHQHSTSSPMSHWLGFGQRICSRQSSSHVFFFLFPTSYLNNSTTSPSVSLWVLNRGDATSQLMFLVYHNFRRGGGCLLWWTIIIIIIIPNKWRSFHPKFRMRIHILSCVLWFSLNLPGNCRFIFKLICFVN